MQHYIYDGSGERVLKANSDMEAVYENGELVNTPGTVSINGYTSYPSAFIVITADGVYSKHYYAGTQRIVSRLGDNDASIFETGCSACKQQSSTSFDDSKLKQAQIQDLNLFAEKAKKGTVTLKEYKPISLEEQEKAMAEDSNRAYAPPSGAGGLYYYHPDHLGTSTALTDFNGNTHQFFLNLPFGETMAQQLGINYYNSPFKFNGKELDEETGFYYYGARYYDPKISIWLSVDPLAEKYPNVGVYVYCLNNPIKYIDPDGMMPWPILEKFKGFGRTHSNNFGEIRQKKDGTYRTHKGLDINHKGGGNTDLNAPIVSTHSGTVTRIAKIEEGDRNAGGTRIVITSVDGTVSTSYMHLNSVESSLKVGSKVAEGQQIGTMGGSGFGKDDAYTSHLHYELRVNGEIVNPVGSDGNLIDPQELLMTSSGSSSFENQKNPEPKNRNEALNKELEMLKKSRAYSPEYVQKRTNEINQELKNTNGNQ